MSAWTATLLSVVVVSLISLIGRATLALDIHRTRRLATLLVSFAVGALLGDAFIHLIPEAFAGESGTLRPSLLVLAGMDAVLPGREAAAPPSRRAAPPG